MSFIANIGWCGRLDENIDPTKLFTPEEIENIKYSNALSKIVLKPVMDKMVAYVNAAREKGLHPNITPYRDVRLFFKSFLEDELPDLIPQSLLDKEVRKVGGGTKKQLSGTDINQLFKEIISRTPNKQEFVEKLSKDFTTWSEDKLENLTKGILGSRYYKGAKGKAAETELMGVDDIGASIARPLSSFMPPEDKFEQGIPDSRIDIEDGKKFVIRSLEAFKDGELSGDPYLSDAVDEIVADIESQEDVETLEDYLTTQARKYLKISQVEDDGSAKTLSDILADAIDNFRHYKLYQAVKDVPENIAIKPESFDAIKDDVLYKIEDYADGKHTGFAKLTSSLPDIVAKIKDTKSKEGLTSYLKDKAQKFVGSQDENIRKLGGFYETIIDQIESIKDTKSVQENVALSARQKNNLLIEGYRNSIRNKVNSQIKLLF